MAGQGWGSHTRKSQVSTIRNKDESGNIIINSGFCTGNDLGKVPSQIKEKEILDGCKGTVRSHNGDGVKIGKSYNSGAFSGNEGSRCGTKDKDNDGCFKAVSGDATDSNVLGTFRSFNAGTYDCLQQVRGDKNLWANLEKSFYQVKNFLKATVDKGGPSESEVIHTGTAFAFNAVAVEGEPTKIDIRNATINSGCCSGQHVNANSYHNLLSEGTFRGTYIAFNAMSGNQIDLKGAEINSGACAGNRLK